MTYRFSKGIKFHSIRKNIFTFIEINKHLTLHLNEIPNNAMKFSPEFINDIFLAATAKKMNKN